MINPAEEKKNPETTVLRARERSARPPRKPARSLGSTLRHSRRWLRAHERSFVRWGFLVALITAGLLLHVKKPVLAALALSWGLATQIFAGAFTLLMGYLGAVPLFGPLVVKVITLPFFLIINGLASLASLVAVRMGGKKKVLEARVAASLLMIGILIGYILGKIF